MGTSIISGDVAQAVFTADGYASTSTTHAEVILIMTLMLKRSYIHSKYSDKFFQPLCNVTVDAHTP